MLHDAVHSSYSAVTAVFSKESMVLAVKGSSSATL